MKERFLFFFCFFHRTHILTRSSLLVSMLICLLTILYLKLSVAHFKQPFSSLFPLFSVSLYDECDLEVDKDLFVSWLSKSKMAINDSVPIESVKTGLFREHFAFFF